MENIYFHYYSEIQLKTRNHNFGSLDELRLSGKNITDQSMWRGKHC